MRGLKELIDMIVGGGKACHQTDHDFAFTRCNIGLGGVLGPIGKDRTGSLQLVGHRLRNDRKNLVDLGRRSKTAAFQRGHAV